MKNEETSFFENWQISSTQKARPLQASLELTNKCNERCIHCYIPEFKDDPERVLSLSDWHKVLVELRSAGVLYIVLMGGEAMLNPLFWEILHKCNELGFHTSMISNGLKLQKKETVQRLIESGLKRVTFSLYSLEPKTHELMTSVRGSFQKTMSAIQLCKSEGLRVGINSLLTTVNVHSIFELQDWCVKNELEMRIDVTITSKLNGDLSPTRLRVSKKQLEWFYKTQTEKYDRAKPKSKIELGSDHVCNAAKGKCAVTAYGELLPCIEIRKPLGNLVTQSFSEAWNGTEAQKWRNIKYDNLNKKSAGGFCDHCPGMANNKLGNSYEEITFSVMLSEVKEKYS